MKKKFGFKRNAVRVQFIGKSRRSVQVTFEKPVPKGFLPELACAVLGAMWEKEPATAKKKGQS